VLCFKSKMIYWMRLTLAGKKEKGAIGFSFAWNGLVIMLRNERNFRIQVIAALIVVMAGYIFKLTKAEWLFIVSVSGMVLVAEMINTTIEKTIDYVKPEHHPTAKLIKDVAAGAVLLAAITAAIIGVIIFLPKIYMHLK